MKENTRTLGKTGEEAAVRFLTDRGFSLIGRNVYADGCEADILACDGTYFVFAEVKTRRALPDVTDKFGRPANAVTPVTKEHMLKMASRYLHDHPEVLEKYIPRLDVIEVYLSPDRDTAEVLEIRHFPDAVRKTPNYRRKNY